MSGKHPLVQAVENAQLKSDIPADCEEKSWSKLVFHST